MVLIPLSITNGPLLGSQWYHNPCIVQELSQGVRCNYWLGGTSVEPLERNANRQEKNGSNCLDIANGEYGIRTRDLRLARAALSHLS